MKNTRRFISGLSALAIAAALAPMSAFATNVTPDTSGNPSPPSAGFEVTYDVDPSYTVTIPAGVDITTGDKTASITLEEGVILPEGAKIEVVLEKGAYTTTGNAFTAKTASGNSSASYQINGGNVKVGDVVASLDKDTLSADLTFSRTETTKPTFAGTHSEVLTFKVSVKEAAKTLTLTGTYFDREAYSDVTKSIEIKYTDNDTWKDIAERYDDVSLLDNSLAPSGKAVMFWGERGSQLKSNESTYSFKLVSYNDKVSAYSSYYLDD